MPYVKTDGNFNFGIYQYHDMMQLPSFYFLASDFACRSSEGAILYNSLCLSFPSLSFFSRCFMRFPLPYETDLFQRSRRKEPLCILYKPDVVLHTSIWSQSVSLLLLTVYGGFHSMVDGFLSSSLINRRSECAFSLQIGTSSYSLR